VTVHRDVDGLLLEHTEVRLSEREHGSSEQDVAQVRGYVLPSQIGESAFYPAENQRNGIRIHTYVGAMHDLHDRGIDGMGKDTISVQHFQPLGSERGPQPGEWFVLHP